MKATGNGHRRRVCLAGSPPRVLSLSLSLSLSLALHLLVRRTLWFRLRWVLNLSLRATVSVCLFLFSCFSCFFDRAARAELSALSSTPHSLAPPPRIPGYYLAKAGAKVALLDKEVFPREKVCGDAVCTPAIHILNEMGVIEQLIKEGKAKMADSGVLCLRLGCRTSGIRCTSWGSRRRVRSRGIILIMRWRRRRPRRGRT